MYSNVTCIKNIASYNTIIMRKKNSFDLNPGSPDSGQMLLTTKLTV